MKAPSTVNSLLALLLRADEDERGDLLFGDSLDRVRQVLPAFMPEDDFPSVYLEFPLLGAPFLDATVLYSHSCARGLSVSAPAAEGTQAMLDWFAGVSARYPDIACGYELDTGSAELTAAGVHFQPRMHTELVEPFCASLGEAWRASLYLDLEVRLGPAWPLSFFGLFRGRPASSLRACGYLSREEQKLCAADAGHIRDVFDAAGFSAYDETMLSQISALLAVSPGQADFQFDVYPDGTLGNTFAIDARFDPRPSADMKQSFREGKNRELMRLIENWGIADSRWKPGVDMSFTRAFPVGQEDGGTGCFALSLLPEWIKIRWTSGILQPSKLYLLAKAGMVK